MTRVGIGYDSHRFAAGRPLVLGGQRIPHDMGLDGHSDADAVAHAVTDAILGAAAAGDIGALFPDTNPENSGRDSMEMLAAAYTAIRSLGYTVSNVDVTVVAETPRIGPHAPRMRGKLATTLELLIDCVSVKGKSNEAMGWIGRGEGLACIAVATLQREP